MDSRTAQRHQLFEQRFQEFTSAGQKISTKADPLSALIADHLDEATATALAAYSQDDAAATKALKSALTKTFNKLVSGSNLYNADRFKNVKLRSEIEAIVNTTPSGGNLARFNRMLLEDAFPDELVRSAPAAWIVKDGAMASTGAGRGVIYTKDDFTKFRLMFTMRQVSGDHFPCILIFCTRPIEGQKFLDALGGIQFQVPNGSHWDYRPGKNKSGDGFTQLAKPGFDRHEWSSVEILVDATAGTARMAIAQPVGAKANEVLDYKMPEAGKTGPIAWQMHNGGIYDEYKDVSIQIDPEENDLITTK